LIPYCKNHSFLSSDRRDSHPLFFISAALNWEWKMENG
jgi:hypothetical protein